jgi:8-oxo-dGTP pyrophosphatase MutT (NUDIX family)
VTRPSATTPLCLEARSLLETWVPPSAEQALTVAEFRQLFADHADPTRRDNPGAHLTAGVVIVSAELDRVLLCLHARVGKWLQLGGHCEDEDTSVAAAALREATEESGIHGLRLDPVPIDLNVHFIQCRNGPSLHYDVRFAAVAPAGAVPVISAESLELAWFPPDALPGPLNPEIVRLIGSGLRAARRLTETGRSRGS